MRYKTLRKVAMILGWKMAKQVAALSQQQWLDWCKHNASVVYVETLEDGKLYVFALKKATLKVFVDYNPCYQEMSIERGNLKIDLL